MMAKPILRQEEVTDGINIIIDDRWVYNLRCESERGPADLVEGGNGGWPNIPVTP
jgi:hypothetical protein